MCVTNYQQLASGGNDHKLIFKATMTSRMPCKAGAIRQVLVVDQMARDIDNEHGPTVKPWEIYAR